MNTVIVSPKFQVVIPKNIRDTLGLVAGQKLQVLLYQNRIEMIPLKPISALKGFLNDNSVISAQDKGISWT